MQGRVQAAEEQLEESKLRSISAAEDSSTYRQELAELREDKRRETEELKRKHKDDLLSAQQEQEKMQVGTSIVTLLFLC